MDEAGESAPEDDIDALIRRARAGDPAAQFDLAHEFESGRRLARDFAAALYWFEEAARNRAPAWELAAERAARYHRDGLATPIDWNRALVLFEESARAYSYARLDVAWAYYWGLGTPRDPGRSAALYEDMYRQYGVTDVTALAAQYALGIGVRQDMARCLEWLRMARDACGRLLAGHALHDADPEKADIAGQLWRHWLAAWSADTHSQFVVSSYMLEFRGNEPRDSPGRMRWLRLAADAGHAAAQRSLAECYYRNSGRSLASRELVLYWTGRAAVQGDGEALRELAQIGDGPA